MKLGFYSPEIKRPEITDVFKAADGYGFEAAQFSFDSVCGEEMPERIPNELAVKAAEAAIENGIAICCVNGTFNMIHPDIAIREDGIMRFEQIAKTCSPLGCGIVSLCTGSRNREHMWRHHEDNDSPGAWADLLKTMERLLCIAQDYGIVLGVETEAANAVNSPQKARLLLDSMKSKHLGIIMDCANIFGLGEAYHDKVVPVLDNAFSLLGDDIVLAHGKDILEGDGIAFTAPGMGIIDYGYFTGLLKKAGYDGPMILHGIKDEGLMAASISHVKGFL